MKDERCVVEENCHVVKQYYMLKINAPYIAENAQPGNFVMLKATVGIEPLLKRPFGIYNAEPPYIWLYYEVIGKGTELIAKLKPGDPVYVLGPLGNRFPRMSGKNILAVAGGRGIAPIYYAIREYTQDNNVHLIYGAKSKNDLNLLENLETEKLKNIFLYTDDGSAGKKGFVTTDIQQIITGNNIHATVSCGPDAMFEALVKSIGHLDIENYVSMEALMGCGFGICYSCVVKTVKDEYKKVCTDGPVFRMEEIAWHG